MNACIAFALYALLLAACACSGIWLERLFSHTDEEIQFAELPQAHQSDTCSAEISFSARGKPLKVAPSGDRKALVLDAEQGQIGIAVLPIDGGADAPLRCG